ncbi:TerB family tellurite resistance protein [Lysobacter panacisoli]|uniref:Co-chaperone DjlA N-terminal domain-containing protein n=1 Tax=Lysobacter panacisoli TaxID=1255263 RepID=A0ABP9LPC0_9GAMM|nr:TerB family tellurite resistance protein [Lysobacter panacisoli]
MEQSLTEQMQDKITAGLRDAFESVRVSRSEYYQANPDKIPNQAAIDALIRAAVTQNAAISGASSLAPGPWGMLAVVPELMLVIKKQVELIYDIGAAHGQKEMPTELLLGVFISAAGSSAGSLLVMHGGKVLVRRASLQVMQKMVALLGGRITQQALKSAVSKWLPGIGAAAMAAWTGYLTKQIGDKAREIFKHEIVNDPTTADIELIKPLELAEPAGEVTEDEAEDLLEFCKLQVLIDLAKIDGRLVEAEQRFIDDALESPELSAPQRERLRAALSGQSEALQGIDVVAARPDSAIALLSNMVALARKDEDFHVTEKLYIKKVGGLLGFSSAEIDDVMPLG